MKKLLVAVTTFAAILIWAAPALAFSDTVTGGRGPWI
jgi:hypothetical protein